MTADDRDVRVRDDAYRAVREKLVDRGYFGGAVERFVLRELVRGGVSALPLATAGKAAVLGAPVAAAVLAVTTALANRPLLGATDVLVLWAYFLVAACAGLFALNLGAAGLARALIALGKPSRQAPVWGGLAIGTVVLVYMTVMWWRREAGMGVWTDAALFVAGLVVAALAAWLARLVSVASVVGRTGDVPERARLRLGLLAALALPVVATLAWTGRGAAVDPSPIVPLDHDARAWVVGIDGVGARTLEALATGAGETTAWDVLLASGGSSWTFDHPFGATPPEVWTTLMSGVEPAVHGVRSAGAGRLPGVSTPIRPSSGAVPVAEALRLLVPSRIVPTSGATRAVRVLPEIVGLARPTAAVGWWASWPASRGSSGGYVVSDRTFAKIRAGGEPDRETSPESLLPRLAAEVADREPAWRTAFEARFGDVLGADAALRGAAWEAYALDRFRWETAALLHGDPDIAATFVYLPGLDILRYRMSGESGGDSGLAGRLVRDRVVAAYAGWIAERIANRVARFPNERLWVIADPGRSAEPDERGLLTAWGRTRALDRPPSFANDEAPGEGDRPLASLDVAPTVLADLGYPLSRELPGRPALSARVEPVDTYGRRPVAKGGARSAFDDEMVERLRSLGYVQ